MELSDLKLSVRTHNMVCRAGLMNISDLYNWQRYRRDELQKWVGKKALAEIDEAFAELEDKGMLEFTTKLPPAPAEATTPEYLAAFNLNARIHYCKDSVERGLAEMCIGIEQMHSEKQYKALGYQNFDEYCQTEFGFTKQQGIKYVSVGKMLAEQNDNSSCRFEELGINKLHLLAKLDEPTREVLKETVDVESATVNELRNEINRITSENADLGQKLDAANEALASKSKQWQASLDSKQHELDDLRAGNKRRYETLFNKIKDLNAQLAEAKEAASQEVAVEDTSRIEELEKQLAECKRQLDERPMVQEALPNDSDARRRGEYSAINNAMIDALDNLMDFLEDNDHCSNFSYFANRAKDKLREYNTRINEMIAEIKEDSSCQ